MSIIIGLIIGFVIGYAIGVKKNIQTQIGGNNAVQVQMKKTFYRQI